MADKSEILGVKLSGLWEAGNVTLPLVAEEYAAASRVLHGVGADEKDVMVNSRKTYDAFPLVPDKNAWVMGKQWIDARALGEMYPHWSHVRATLQEAMARTAENLYATGTALGLIIRHYAETDQAAADVLNTYAAERSDDTELGPPDGPAPISRPGDPHPVDPMDAASSSVRKWF